MSKAYNPLILSWGNNSILLPEWGEMVLCGIIIAVYCYIAWRIMKA